MSDINYGEILEALNDKCDRDMGNSEKPYITETYSSGTSWYRVYSDGWCEQGGYSSTSSNVNTTVTLLKQYNNPNYTISVTPTTSTGSAETGIISKTSSSFTFNCYGGGVNGACWIAKGYIA